VVYHSVLDFLEKYWTVQYRPVQSPTYILILYGPRTVQAESKMEGIVISIDIGRGKRVSPAMFAAPVGTSGV